MLTLRRGIARAGWVLLALWVCVWVVIVVTGRSQSPSPPPIDAMLALQLVAFVLAWPLAIFLLWRLLLWIGQGFWQEHEATPTVAAPKVFRLPPEFWTIRTMALLGAVLFAAYGVFGLQAELALGGDYASRAVGSLIGYAAVGAIFGAVMARLMPRQ
jgi:hypothetical protein